MNMKEQALKVLHSQTPDITPSYFTTCQVMVCSAYPDMPPYTAGERGRDAYGVMQVQEGAPGLSTRRSRRSSTISTRGATSWFSQIPSS